MPKEYTELWYVAIYPDEFNLQEAFAGISALMQICLEIPEKVPFIIAVAKDFSSERYSIFAKFEGLQALLEQECDPFFVAAFNLEIWDNDGLAKTEKDLYLNAE